MSLVLIKPSEEHIAEITDYKQESEVDGHIHGTGGIQKYETVEEWIAQARLCESKKTVPPGFVTANQYMLVQEGEKRILGMINFRHSLGEHDSYLAEFGGHIGYSVRPSERRKGHAKTMVLLCLEHCRKLGLSRVLLTCTPCNEASRRVIVSCGGKFERLAESDAEELERYWIEL